MLASCTTDTQKTLQHKYIENTNKLEKMSFESLFLISKEKQKVFNFLNNIQYTICNLELCHANINITGSLTLLGLRLGKRLTIRGSHI